MKYAIDRFRQGKEEEVSAESFYEKAFLHRKARFFCPECGEPVFWRSRGGNQPDMFCHYRKTETSPECEKRVNGQSSLYLYERIGLPLSLERKRDNIFQLNFIFPPLGEDLIDCAIKRNAKVYISDKEDGKAKQSRSIDHTNFYDDSSTMVPINFVPKETNNYSIRIEGPDEINKRWSNYADGFAMGGAFFSYDETGGRKIRRGDSISIKRKYYVASENFSPKHGEIKVEKIGVLRHTNYKIYIVSIDISITDTKFEEISNYMKERFSVQLIETPSELIPLWPPVTEHLDVFIPIKKTNSLFCAISSGNRTPKVYTYDKNKTAQLHSVDDQSVILPIETRGTIVSVDRRYAGRERTYQYKPFSPIAHTYELILKRDNKPIDGEALTPRDLASNFCIWSNAKMKVYIESRDKIYREIRIQEPETTVSKLRNTSAIHFAVAGEIFRSYRTKIPTKAVLHEKNILHLIRKRPKGTLVPVPRWVRVMLLQWKINGWSDLVATVDSTMIHGKIPLGLLQLLAGFC